MMTRLRFAFSVAACWALVGVDGVMGAEPAVAPTTPEEVAAQIGLVRTLGDERAVDVAAEWAVFESRNKTLIGSVAPKPVAFEKAVAKARELAKKAVNETALKASRAKITALDDVTAYRMLAGIEMVRGNPDGALCYLVFAHDSDSKNAEALNDLAGLLAMFGYANESLAILDELAKRGAVISPPMGLTQADVQDYTRGYGELRLGRHDEARRLLEAVRDRQPLLSEAPELLALLDAQEGKSPRKNFIMSRWRARAKVSLCAGVEPGQREPDAFQEDEARESDEVAIDIRSWVNLSKGEPGKLPTVPYAVNSPQANWLVPRLEAKKRAEQAVFDDIVRKLQDVETVKYVHTNTDVLDTWGHRIFSVLEALDRRDEKLRALNEKVRLADETIQKERPPVARDMDTKANEARNKLMFDRAMAKQPSPTLRELGAVMKPFTEGALGKTRGAFMRKETAIRQRFAEWHLLATALAGEVGDAKWREYIQLTIEAERSKVYLELLACAEWHATIGLNALLDAEEAGDGDDKESQGMGSCDPNKSVGVSLSGMGFAHNVPFAKELEHEIPLDIGVEATCEGLSLELSAEVFPKLQISSEFGVDKKGGFSFFIGPKMDATFEGTGATWKTGFGVSGTRSEGITDITAKSETKLVAASKGVSHAVKVSDISLSFLPSAQGGPPAGLVPIGKKVD